MTDSASTSATPAAPQQPPMSRTGRIVTATMHGIVLVLSALLIIFISVDTFERVNFLENHAYMTFQLWVCIFFMIDFFVELYYAPDKWRYTRHRLIFLLLSIPYLNFVNYLGLSLTPEDLYFVRFIPLARGALALSLVVGYFSSNAITSFFMSYLIIMVMVCYFCSLIFFQMEHGVNPQVETYWTALWWAAMNMSTVGCYINPMTIAGKIVAVILPVAGMIIFPLFTVYLTDFVRRNGHKLRSDK